MHLVGRRNRDSNFWVAGATSRAPGHGGRCLGSRCAHFSSFSPLLAPVLLLTRPRGVSRVSPDASFAAGEANREHRLRGACISISCDTGSKASRPPLLSLGPTPTPIPLVLWPSAHSVATKIAAVRLGYGSRAKNARKGAPITQYPATR